VPRWLNWRLVLGAFLGAVASMGYNLRSNDLGYSRLAAASTRRRREGGPKEGKHAD
jgi:hypothetical protein